MRGVSFFLTLFLWFVLLSVIFGTPGKLALFPLLIIIVGMIFDTPGGFTVEREVTKRRVFVGEEVRVKLRVRVSKGIGIVILKENLPRAFEVKGSATFHFFTYPGKREFSFEYSFVPRRKGEYDIPKTEVFAYHFMRLHPMRWGLYGNGEKILVIPKLSATSRLLYKRMAHKLLPQLSLSKTGPQSTDFLEIREYRPGDPFKAINWKATARSGKLLVNEFEREGKDTIMIFLDSRISVLEGEKVFEKAISLAYSLAMVHLKKGDNVGLYIIGQGKIVTPSSSASQMQTIMKALIGATYAKDETLKEGFERAFQVLLKFKPRTIIITSLDPRILEEVKVLGPKFLIVDVLGDYGDVEGLVVLRRRAMGSEIRNVVHWRSCKEPVDLAMVKVEARLR
ncbi:DUF58 domain-containing protein [Pyrococcus abyssi]|uniref:X-prolyl dipeptidyl aminopeptidase n=1 Tax=Pyrococcus abyssi (strain GE5 / Orsay) TaxID=272844 RepID=Q9UY77_PYRAB|nr:DUF58 domain-containing protein [Pyrococcus abyssi]CAB50535.1 Hypothetical protein PAB1277 [Pyrococcus abyssi GE5]CCE71092.1 TPA: X-prolyl dipeptidyl aminopeptidase [Pyrococcus abyssi GE5]